MSARMIETGSSLLSGDVALKKVNRTKSIALSGGKKKVALRRSSKGKLRRSLRIRSYPVNGDGSPRLRCSRRARCPPLQFWLGERLRYKFTKSGGTVEASSVIDPGSDSSSFRTMTKKGYASADPNSGLEVLDDEDKKTGCGVAVRAEIVKPFEGLSWEEYEMQDGLFKLSYSFSVSGDSLGFLHITGHQQKPIQRLPGYDCMFTVVEGNLSVILGEREFRCGKYDSFIVPKGLPYSIRNRSPRKSLLSFRVSTARMVDFCTK